MARISIIRNNEFQDLDEVEARTVRTLENKEKAKVRDADAGKLTYKGRPLPDHNQRAIDEADKRRTP